MSNELDRILALPKRDPIDCERERGARRWAPEAQALIEIVTARYALPPRLSCGCRIRTLQATGNGGLLVLGEGRIGASPPAPLQTTVDAFCRDNAHDADVVRQVSAMRNGETLELKGLGVNCITEFNPVQAWTLYEVPRTRGAFGLCSVGSGKTVCSLMIPLSAPELQTWVLFAKPDQRLHYRRHYLALREHFRVPSIVFGGDTLQGSYIVPGAPVVHFIPYSLLSNPKSSRLLDQLEPRGIVADECHKFSNIRSTTTMRWLRMMRERPPEIFCGWTGSAIDKSIKNCAHIVAYALGMGSPYPIKDENTIAYAAVMDPSPVPDTTSGTAKQLRAAFSKSQAHSDVFEAGLLSDSSIREGHRDRVICTPGIISTKSSSVKCSLTISERKAPPMPDIVKEALKKARLGVRWDTEELAEQTEIAVCIRAAGTGYYNYWSYPRSKDEDRVPGGLIEKWFAARKAFYKELRGKLLAGEVHLDSPMLCMNAAERAYRIPRYDGDLPVWPAVTWPEWRDIKDLVEPDPRTKFIDDYLAKDAAAWATENRGIVWCRSRAFGMRIAELAGINYHGGGPEAEARLLAEDGAKSIVVSIKAHGEGRDGLQYKYHKQLLAELMPSGKGMEQLLGRLCREGQAADTVEMEIYRHVSEYRDDFARALMYARFIEETTPNRQLLMAADLTFDV